MKNYMVHFRRGMFEKADPVVIQNEQARMGELMRDNILKQVYMNKTADNLYMIFSVESEDRLKDIIKTLPMSSNLFFEYEELMG